MRWFYAVCMGWCLLPLWTQAQDLTANDRVAIRTVIEQQIEAFRRDDAAAAFSYASAAIQQQFETPERFMRMVKTAYQPVYRPRRVVFQEIDETASVPIQPVLLVGPDGVPVIALYPMRQETDGVWRIDGCYLKAIKQERL
ncbi:DUF4864 domain-containing protein [Candidatus Entotheonella palauensis]|uniref:DUF4864 domain-containing protein n=1 Tax=Candidatus Entotheonella gemina TaxID=1429439 RepID=W4LPE8_9BACT|nr:DUF4864 domain-containing protein [Candidatus Entotheonella palauensis]ETW99744.1 MAG: hypothetical protein ETSY2_40290 [Candidatus Entotheonella gemina]